MNKLYSIVFLLTTLLCGAFLMARAEETDKPGRLLRHAVFFKFKQEVTQEQIDEVVRAFAALPRRIDLIQDFEWGMDVSVENKAKGFTHAFLVTFRTEEARDKYLPHPAHQEFVKLVGPRVADVFVVDYWAQE